MKQAKTKEKLSSKSAEDLKKLVEKLKKETFDLRMKLRLGKLKKNTDIRAHKRSIARALTELRKKELSGTRAS